MSDPTRISRRNADPTDQDCSANVRHQLRSGIAVVVATRGGRLVGARWPSVMTGVRPMLTSRRCHMGDKTPNRPPKPKKPKPPKKPVA